MPGNEETALARQALYRLASMALADPRSGTWAHLSDPATRETAVAAAGVLRADPATCPPSLGPGENPPNALDVAAVFDSLPALAKKYEQAHARIFGLVVSSAACPSHETEYVSGKEVFQRSHALADVSGFYRAFGLAPSRRFPDRPDHISRELEYMACVVGLEHAATKSGDRKRATVCRDAQRRFLEEHIAWWVPAFARLLSHEASGSGFHGAVAALLMALIPAERGLLAVPAPEREVRAQSSDPEACGGCAGAVP